jgi:hypothetical protein
MAMSTLCPRRLKGKGCGEYEPSAGIEVHGIDTDKLGTLPELPENVKDTIKRRREKEGLRQNATS